MAAPRPPFPTPEAGPAFHPEAGPFYCGIGPVTGGLFSSQRARTSTLLHPRDYPGAGHGGPLLRGRCLTPWAPASRRTDPRRRLRVKKSRATHFVGTADLPQTVCPSLKRRLTLDITARVTRIGRAEPQTRRASRGPE